MEWSNNRRLLEPAEAEASYHGHIDTLALKHDSDAVIGCEAPPSKTAVSYFWVPRSACLPN